MAASALPLAVSAGLKVASLNLCTDEYLLLLARPGEIASTSYLSSDPLESPLSARARRTRPNDGTLESVIGAGPTLVMTMGGGGRSTTLIGRRLGMRFLDLAAPTSLDDVAANLRRVAAALGNPPRAAALLARLAALRESQTAAPLDAILLAGGGLSTAANGIGAQWMRLAGLRQRTLPGGRASLELLATAPPRRVLVSDYRKRQTSRAQQWFRHPIVERLAGRSIATDGRRWTCMGPLLIAEVERLRRVQQ